MTIYKMETQKIVNLLNDTDNESSRFATRKWYVINDQNNTEYCEGNENDSSIKFETKVAKSSLCDCSDAYILVTGDITVTGGIENAEVAFKNWASFTRCVTQINDEHINTAANVDIIIPIYNLIEYNNNCSHIHERSWQFKRDAVTDAGNPGNVSRNNSSSFK